MKSHLPRRVKHGLRTKAVAVAAGALALTLGASVAASANDAAGQVVKEQAARHTAPAVSTFSTQNTVTPNTLPDPNNGWSFGINGRDSGGYIWEYAPKSGGGFAARDQVGHGFSSAGALFQNNSADSGTVNLYARFGSTLYMYAGDSQTSGEVIGSGWQIYNAFVTPGNIGGGAYPDLLARDTSGVLWEYLSYSDGHFASRTRIGAGWNIYTQIAGRGDLTGDGKADIVARDSSGVLWLYRGTGSWSAPFAPRVRIGSGWNTYNKILGLGDSNGDGRNDLIARDGSGNLYLYAGTGSATAPYKPRVKIGWGWNTYNYLF